MRACVWLLDTHAIEWWHDGVRSHWKVTPLIKPTDKEINANPEA